MNAENFREYLKDPSLLYQVPYEELKSLALEYPYSAHLRWLLLQKSRMEHRPDARVALEKAAVYSIDRRALYRFIQTRYEKTETPFFVFNEDFLELKDLAVLREALPAPVEEDVISTRLITPEPAPVFREAPVAPKSEETEDELTFDFTSDAAPLPVEAPALIVPTVSEIEAIVTSDTTVAEVSEPDPVHSEVLTEEATPAEEIVWEIARDAEPAEDGSLVQRIAGDAVALAGIVEYRAALAAAEAVLEKAAQIAPAAPIAAPLPKTSFKTWMHATPPSLVSEPIAESPAASQTKTQSEKKSKKSPDIVTEIARLSVTENAALASETLADLLAAQQQYDKAAKMYERLMMKFPEKSAYFAAKIEKLKKK